MSILRKIFKAGNSKVISIPQYLLKEMGANNGSYVRIDPIREQGEDFISINIIACRPFKDK